MAQQSTEADGGESVDDDDAPSFAEPTVTTEVALLEVLDEDTDDENTREYASRLLEVLEESGASLIQLKSSWHGNEFIGDWADLWFAHIDFETDKAIHMSEVIEAGYPVRMVRNLRRAVERYGDDAPRVDDYEARAFKQWEDATMQTDSWGSPSWRYTTDEYCPKSAITAVITAPARDDHYVVSAEGMERGTLDEADIYIRKTVTHEYESNQGHRREEKFAVEGDTYEAFVSANLKNVLPFMPVTDDDGETTEPGTFHSFTGDQWVVGMDGLPTFIRYATEAGFTVGVHSEYEEYLNDE